MTVFLLHVETGKMFKAFFLLSRAKVLIFHTQKNSFTGFCCIVLESYNCTFSKHLWMHVILRKFEALNYDEHGFFKSTAFGVSV